MDRKHRMREMMKAMMMMMVTSLQIEPKYGTQMKHEDSGIRITIVMARCGFP
jgi:hypothetical protein